MKKEINIGCINNGSIPIRSFITMNIKTRKQTKKAASILSKKRCGKISDAFKDIQRIKRYAQMNGVVYRKIMISI